MDGNLDSVGLVEDTQVHKKAVQNAVKVQST